MWNKFKKKINLLDKNVNKVKKITGNFYLFILFDIVVSIIVYGISSDEYRYYEFYNINCNKRKTYISRRKRNEYRLFLNEKKITSIIGDKSKFQLRFKDYIKSELYNINDLSFKQYEEYIKDNQLVIFREKNKKFYDSFKTYDLNNYRSPAFLLDDAKKNKCDLFEKMINQGKKLKDVTSDLIVLNIVTLVKNRKCNVVSSNIKFKDKNDIISGFIDNEKGILIGHLRKKDYTNYSDITYNLEIPYFNECVDFVTKLALELDEIREIEWSLCISSQGKIYLMDANLWDDYIFAQLPEFTNYGLVEFYKRNF